MDKHIQELIENLKNNDCYFCAFAAGVIFAQAKMIEILTKPKPED